MGNCSGSQSYERTSVSSLLTKIKFFFHSCRNTPDNYKWEYVELVEVIWFDKEESSGVIFAKYKLTCLVCGKEKYVFKDFFFTPYRGITCKEAVSQARSYIG